jgi:hypothetical protein
MPNRHRTHERRLSDEALPDVASVVIRCSRTGLRLPGGRNAETHIHEHGGWVCHGACV